MPPFDIQPDGSLRIRLDEGLRYSKTACLKAAHQLSARFLIHIVPEDNILVLHVCSKGEALNPRDTAAEVLQAANRLLSPRTARPGDAHLSRRHSGSGSQ